MASMNESALVGKRQEILDKVFNIEAEATPFLSMLKAGKKPANSLCNWVCEVLPAVASTGVLDGTAATAPSKVDRYNLVGCVQHFRQQWGVTLRAELTEVAGIADEAGHQRMLAMLLLKRQMELQFLSESDSAEESGAKPWTTRGVLEWLQNGAQSNNPVPAAVRPASATVYTGALASYAETSFTAQMAAAYAAKKAQLKLDLFPGRELKNLIDVWTIVHPAASTTNQPRLQYVQNDSSRWVQNVDYLETTYGVVRVHSPSEFLKCDTATGAQNATSLKVGVGLAMDQWDIGYMAKPANTNLAPDGSGPKGFIDAFAVLRCLSPLGQIAINCAS